MNFILGIGGKELKGVGLTHVHSGEIIDIIHTIRVK
jgi:hypothetical protein